MESNREGLGSGEGEGSGAAVIASSLRHATGEDDVLFGRGKGAYNHEGNVRFRTLVLERAVSYKRNESKAFRRSLAREVIKQVEARGGKFLRPVESRPSSGESTYSYRLESVPDALVLNKVKQALRDMSAAILQEPKLKKTTVPVPPTSSLPRPELAAPSALLEPILSDPFSEDPFGNQRVEGRSPPHFDGWMQFAKQQEETQRQLSYLGQQLAFQSVQQQLAMLQPTTMGQVATGREHLVAQPNHQQHYMGLDALFSPNLSPATSLSDHLLLHGAGNFGPHFSLPSSILPSSILPTVPYQPVPLAGHVSSTIDQPSLLRSMISTCSTENTETVAPDTTSAEDEQTSISSSEETNGDPNDKY